MKKMLLVIGCALMLATARPMRAQDPDVSPDVTGCVDSPEDPTVVLALVAGVGTLAAGWNLNRKREK